MIHLVPWTVTSAFLANVVVLGTCIVLARPLRHVPIPAVRTYWYDLALRALLVAMLVGFVVSVSFQIGPAGSGILAVFPIILISLMLILHRRIGGKPTAAILANGVLGLVGFGFACVVLHFSADAARRCDRADAGALHLGRLGHGRAAGAPPRHRGLTRPPLCSQAARMTIRIKSRQSIT